MTTKIKIFMDIIIYSVLIIIIFMAGYKLFFTMFDYRSASKEYVDLAQNYNLVSSNKNNSTLNNDIYRKNMICPIDFESLKKINSNIIGWIKIPDTEINYPIVQTTDNEYYLFHTFRKEKKSAGCIFLDYQNNEDFSSYVNYIYGHNMKDGTMFHNLRYYMDKSFYEKHSLIYIYTPQKNIELKIIGTILCDETDEIYSIKNITYDDYLKLLKNKNLYSTNVSYDINKNVFILSTCYGKTKRLLVYAQKS